MPNIQFINHPSISYKEAAQLIRREGRLTTHFFTRTVHSGRFIGQCLRCASGVIEDWKIDNLDHKTIIHTSIQPFFHKYHLSLIAINDAFKGTEEERAEYIAELLEAV